MKLKPVFYLLLIMLTVCSCQSTTEYKNTSFFAMNTYITVIGEEGTPFSEVQELTQEYENIFSKTIAESDISVLNRDGKAELSSQADELLSMSLEIANTTHGAFNPCMGEVTSLWDITSGENYVPSDEEISKAVALTDFGALSVNDGKAVLSNKGVQVDLGGIAKGYTLGKAVSLAKEQGAKNFCISFGGNVGTYGSSKSQLDKGKNGWVVGITNPYDKENTLGSVVLHDEFISISGAYERFFEKDGVIYHHIFDSSTGRPAKSDIASSCVVSKDAALGDALSTALFVMGKEKAASFYESGKYDFDMIIITNDNTVIVTEGIKSRFTLYEDVPFTVISIDKTTGGK